MDVALDKINQLSIIFLLNFTHVSKFFNSHYTGIIVFSTYKRYSTSVRFLVQRNFLMFHALETA